jgi:hypothetical protein
LWGNLIAGSVTITPPKFEVADFVHTPPTKDILSPFEEEAGANVTSSNWSGAVQTTAPTGQTFFWVSAKWIVPSVYPPASAKTSTGAWEDGTYYVYSWVGIDGYFNSPSQVLQTGTAGYVTVSGGVVGTPQYWGWHEWYPAGIVQYSNFPVEAGDLIYAFVYGVAGANTAYVGLYNYTRAASTGTLLITAPSGITLKGIDAEWILEGNTENPFPNYGAEVFFDTFAESRSADGTKVTEFDLTGATLVNAVHGTTIESTAVEDNSTTLLTYSYTDGP